LAEVDRRDPSQPWSTRLQKWVVFSAGLALLALFSDVIAGLVLTNGARPVDVLGRGELYMASVGMLFSAAGELLYDRTRTDIAGSWQITMAVFTMMFALCPASLFGLAKAGKSDPIDVMTFSITFAALSLAWGVVLVYITDMGRRRAGKP
jgi:hypothetical protein